MVGSLGLLSPANPGGLGISLLVVYACLGTVAGYTSAHLYRSKGYLGGLREWVGGWVKGVECKKEKNKAWKKKII